jgi:hypothetical protein
VCRRLRFTSQARAFLDDVDAQTIAASTELLVGLVEGAFSNGVADMLGAEMARASLRVRVVLWHVDLGALARALSAKQSDKPSLARMRATLLLRLHAALLLFAAHIHALGAMLRRAVRVLELLERACGGRGVSGASHPRRV